MWRSMVNQGFWLAGLNQSCCPVQPSGRDKDNRDSCTKPHLDTSGSREHQPNPKRPFMASAGQVSSPQPLYSLKKSVGQAQSGLLIPGARQEEGIGEVRERQLRLATERAAMETALTPTETQAGSH